MNLKKLILPVVLASSFASNSFAHSEEVKIMHLQMGGNYHQLFMQELMSQPSATGEPVQATYISTPNAQGANPFHLTAYNWDFGSSFFKTAQIQLSQIPMAHPNETSWFQTARQNGKMPDLMIISGHHIPGIGWHSDSTWGKDQYYSRSLLLSSLLRLREENADARAFFDNVKFVFISGCWGLSNMEPHGSNGEVLSQEQTVELYQSGDEGRKKIHGNKNNFYSVEAQRWELTTLYDGDFAASSADAICDGLKCATFDIHKVMSDIGLLDGSHRYNQPLNLRKLFPNAAVIFGFHSPSPYNQSVKQLIHGAVTRARHNQNLQEEDQAYAANIIQSIISTQTPEPTKLRLVQAFREAWTTITWEHNKGSMPSYYGGRPGASITPAYPELDNDGVFAWPKDYKNPSFAPRCFQYRADAKPCQQ